MANTSEFKTKTVTKRQLMNFKFRFINHVTRGLYEIVDAEQWAKEVNARKPHYIGTDRMAFWTDEYPDHSCVLEFKHILPL